MDQDNGSKRQNDQEGKGSSSGNALLYALLLGAIVMLLVLFVFPGTGERIIISDLEKLIENSGPGKSGEIVVTRDDTTIVYSNLKDIEVGPQTATGKVLKQVRETTDGGSEGVESLEPAKEVEFVTYLSPKDESEKSLRIKLTEAKLDCSYKKPASAWERYGPLLIFSGVLLFLFFVMMRRLGGAGSAMAFGRSRGKLYAQEDLGVSFDDVAGIDEAVEELREVVDFLSSPDKYQETWWTYPQRCVARRSPRYGQDSVGQSDCGRSRRAVLRPLGK